MTVLGYLALPPLGGVILAAVGGRSLAVRPLELFDPVTDAITTAIGPGASFLLAVAVLFGSLKLFDWVLSQVDTGTLRTRFFDRFRRTWLSFAIGLVVTGLTTSVAFSLGVIVPLYNRRYVKRDELIPYVLGANLGTLFDTLVVAVVLGTSTGVAVVVLVVGVASAVTLVALAAIDHYSRLVPAVDDRLVEDRIVFGAFAAALVLVPLAVLVLPTLFR